jgi:protein-L-isoaspartate(D-aspartate) O-methyltransferase
VVFGLALVVAIGAGLFTDQSLKAQAPLQIRAAREKLVNQIVAGGDLQNPRVIASLRATPRHEFIPLADRRMAYYDMSLPIGFQQTISSPFIVGFMTEVLDPQPEDRVLEIGTGSGYQAAILSPLVKEVYTIEIIEPLAQRAERTLRRLGYANVQVRAGDGYQGWPERAPFDKIIVTCSPDRVPKALVEQLADGGRMVIPVGERHQQTLYLYRKVEGKLESEPLRPTLFVPMLGQAYAGREEEWEEGKPGVVNGDFEAPLGEEGFVTGWYYQRQTTLATASPPPHGGQYVTFRNETLSRPSHLLQGMAVDGSKVSQLRLSAWVRLGPLLPNPSPEMQPNVLLRFFDAQRREIAYRGLGPLRPTGRWEHLSQVVRVPPQAREAILHIGLFGAVGEASVDNIQVEIVP